MMLIVASYTISLSPQPLDMQLGRPALERTCAVLDAAHNVIAV